MSFRKVAIGFAGASLAAWVVLALCRGRFWRVRVDELQCGDSCDRRAFRVEAVVPARNEAETIGRAVASLVSQDYEGSFGITLVDDESDDGTADIARESVLGFAHAGRLRTIRGRPLEASWTGKLNALDAGVADVTRARGVPDYWLFADADIEHHASNLSELVAKAERDDLDLVSLMVRLRCESAWEKLLVPAFVFFFAKLYPFAWSNDPRRATAAAAGGCVLLRASALARIGGLHAISNELIDDCALARAVKRSGERTWLGLTSQTRSIRAYGSLESIWNMVKRSAFTQLDRSYFATAGATVAMTFLYLVPPGFTLLAIVRRDATLAAVAGSAWMLMAALYRPMQRAYDRPVLESFALPIAATLYMVMTVDSAIAHARGAGGVWKGRANG